MKDKTLKLFEEKERRVDEGVAQFDEDGLLPMPESPGDTIHQIILLMEGKDAPGTAEQGERICSEIIGNVKAGKPNNMVINFCKGYQRCHGKQYKLGDTVVKLRIMDVSKPVYFFWRSGDTPDFIVFVGGDNVWAFLAIRNVGSDIIYVRLSEFHLFSLSENSKPGDAIGLMTGYIWLNARVFTDVIMGMNLYPVIDLLMAEKVQMEEAEKQKEIERQKTMEDNGDERKAS